MAALLVPVVPSTGQLPNRPVSSVLKDMDWVGLRKGYPPVGAFGQLSFCVRRFCAELFLYTSRLQLVKQEV